MDSRFSFVAKMSWVDWLALIALGSFLFATILWLPKLFPETGGGWYSGTRFTAAFLQLDLAELTCGLGTMLFAVRPLLALRSPLIPVLITSASMATSAAPWMEPEGTCMVFDHLTGSLLNDLCDFFAPAARCRISTVRHHRARSDLSNVSPQTQRIRERIET
jgi:hypothetical protein